MGKATELVLIRHAPAAVPGRLFGRTDVPADISAVEVARAIGAAVGEPEHLLSSPLRRAVATAGAIWPDRAPRIDDRLSEQDFGAWEGQPYADLPPLGENPRAALAGLAPPGGESFAALLERVGPALQAAAGLGGQVAIVAHAGVIRAALSLALDSEDAGLAFSLANWSVTRIVAVAPQGPWAVRLVNWTPDARG